MREGHRRGGLLAITLLAAAPVWTAASLSEAVKLASELVLELG
jgi:hypothetical protein